MKQCLLLLFASSCLTAQIGSITAAGSGDVVYFTTWLRPIGTDHLPWQKAYRLSSGQVELVAQQDLNAPAGWRVERVATAADGSVIGIDLSSPCHFGTGCLSRVQEFSEIRTPQGTRSFTGDAQIPPSGRFALLTRSSGFGLFTKDDQFQRPVRRVRLDQPDAAPEDLGGFPASTGRWVANDGTALVSPGRGTRGWELVSTDGERTVLELPPGGAKTAVLLPDASAIVYVANDFTLPSGPAPPGELRIRFLDQTDISLGVRGELIDISDDGSRVLIVRDVDGAAQAYIVEIPSGTTRQVTDYSAGVEAVDLSEDGSKVIAVTDDRLVQIDFVSDESTVLLGPLPNVVRGPVGQLPPAPIAPAVVPGSTYRIRGDRIATKVTVSGYPADSELDGIRIEVGGQNAALLWTSPYEIGYQVAWDAMLSETAVIVVRHENSGWDTPLRTEAVRVRHSQSALPEIYGFQLAVHQNFDRLVTPADPALPGEYIHIYATGLGPTAPALATGHPGPTDPLSVTTIAPNWRILGGDRERPAEVVFAGLAPGFVGFYQVVWKIPSVVTSERMGLQWEPGFLGWYPVKLSE